MEAETEETICRLQNGFSERSVLFFGESKRRNTEKLNQIRSIVNSYPITRLIWIKATRKESFVDNLYNGLQEISKNLAAPQTKCHSPAILDSDLADLMRNTGEIAKFSSRYIFIFVEDLHCVRKADLHQFCSAISRANQLNLPIVAFMAGLPSVIRSVGNACPDAERLFIFNPS